MRIDDQNLENLPKEADKTLLDENIRVLKAVASSYRIGGIWAAWGDIIDTRFYLGEALFDIQEALEGDYWWFYAGKMTKKRNPRHPLYLDTDAERNEFYVWDYASVWKNADYD